ncbi:hypothetical protein DL95DRAFT_371020 [Leptodontidium sp. 2 PMI_412]|nr:hypothetical protein DL95DRAFT_371020 [Leptodontidium sp. 2 PMI_412]
MSKQRKPHRKSRDGCAQCKERHIKCNEVHPQCLNCERQNISCSFSSPSLTVIPLNEDSLADLELLEYWHRHPLTPDQTEQARRREYDAVRLGFSHHYLLNSILALAALQLFREDRSRTRWYARAVAHQHAAISRARPHFQNVEESQYRAMLGFSAFTSLYAIAEPLLRPNFLNGQYPNFDPIKELLHAIQLGKCTAAFVQQHLGFLLCSDPFMVSKFSHNRVELIQGLESRFPQLALLRSLIERLCQGEQRRVCLQAVNLLFTYIATLTDNPGNIQHTTLIYGWPNVVDGLFLDMCSARHAMALVILAHYAVLMNLNQDLWFFQGWPPVLLSYIWELLKDEWEDMLRWPMEMIHGTARPSYRTSSGCGSFSPVPMLESAGMTAAITDDQNYALSCPQTQF